MHTLTESLLNDVLDRLEEESVRLRDALHCETEESVRVALRTELVAIHTDRITIQETFGL